jgi:hypothetical protein
VKPEQLIVIVRYVGYTRLAVIAQQKQSKHNRRRTKNSSRHANQWYVKEWLS